MAHGTSWTTWPKTSVKRSSVMVLTSSRLIRPPPATRGPRAPMWKNTMLSTIAATAPMLMPLPKIRLMPVGMPCAMSGYEVTHSAKAKLVVTMMRLR